MTYRLLNWFILKNRFQMKLICAVTVTDCAQNKFRVILDNKY